jgi:hypothetical protein
MFRALLAHQGGVYKFMKLLLKQKFYSGEFKSRLKKGNACSSSVQNLLSSSLLSQNLKFRIYKTIIVSVLLYECETWSLTLREERRLKVFENWVLRIFGPRWTR